MNCCNLVSLKTYRLLCVLFCLGSLAVELHAVRAGFKFRYHSTSLSIDDLVTLVAGAHE